MPDSMTSNPNDSGTGHTVARRPVRDVAITILMFETGLRSSEVAALDVNQLRFTESGHLGRATSGVLEEVAHVDGTMATVQLSHEVCTQLSAYLSLERSQDAPSEINALFLVPPSASSGPRRMTAEEIDTAVGGERNIHRVRTRPGAKIPPDELQEIRAVVSEWIAANDQSLPTAGMVVSGTVNAATQLLSEETVWHFPDRAIYLVILKGTFTLTDGVARSNEDLWIALFVNQSEPLRVASPALPLRDDHLLEHMDGLGAVHPLKFQ